jgi:hypothetical protein
MSKMIKSLGLHVRVSPKTIDSLDLLSKLRGIPRSEFVEDTVMALITANKNNPALKDVLGAAYYEKYLK